MLAAIVVVTLSVLAVVIALSCIYLSYQKSEQAEKIINLLLGFVGGAIAGLAGGISLGQITKGKKNE